MLRLALRGELLPSRSLLREILVNFRAIVQIKSNRAIDLLDGERKKFLGDCLRRLSFPVRMNDRIERDPTIENSPPAFGGQVSVERCGFRHLTCLLTHAHRHCGRLNDSRPSLAYRFDSSELTRSGRSCSSTKANAFE